MDARLREAYREYGGSDIRFLLMCSRMGHIPLDAHIELTTLPEIAKVADIRQSRIGHLSDEEMGLILDYPHRSNIIGEMTGEYVINSDNWTLAGWNKQRILDRFLDWIHGPFRNDGWDEDLLYMLEDYDVTIDPELQISLAGDLDTLYGDLISTEITELHWRYYGTYIRAVVQFVSRVIDYPITTFMVLGFNLASVPHPEIISEFNITKPGFVDIRSLGLTPPEPTAGTMIVHRQ